MNFEKKLLKLAKEQPKLRKKISRVLGKLRKEGSFWPVREPARMPFPRPPSTGTSLVQQENRTLLELSEKLPRLLVKELGFQSFNNKLKGNVLKSLLIGWPAQLRGDVDYYLLVAVGDNSPKGWKVYLKFASKTKKDWEGLLEGEGEINILKIFSSIKNFWLRKNPSNHQESDLPYKKAVVFSELLPRHLQSVTGADSGNIEVLREGVIITLVGEDSKGKWKLVCTLDTKRSKFLLKGTSPNNPNESWEGEVWIPSLNLGWELDKRKRKEEVKNIIRQVSKLWTRNRA